MKIETEFNIGDKVYLIVRGVIHSGIVENILVNVNQVDTWISYNLKDCSTVSAAEQAFEERILGATPEALCQKMLNRVNQ